MTKKDIKMIFNMIAGTGVLGGFGAVIGVQQNSNAVQHKANTEFTDRLEKQAVMFERVNRALKEIQKLELQYNALLAKAHATDLTSLRALSRLSERIAELQVYVKEHTN